MPDNMSELNQALVPLRQQIDSIDLQLLKLINARADLAQQVGQIKQQLGVVSYQPEREKKIIHNLEKANSGPLTHASITHIWREIMSACRALEETTSVAYLGPSGTFSEIATLQYFGHSISKKPCISIDEVFRTVSNEEIKYGVVPVENSSEGPVSRTLDLLLETTLYINAELSIPIHHHLLSHSSTTHGISIIRAHPQALAQCQHWLNHHYPHIERQAVSSTAEAARLAANDRHSAAIASEVAAQEYGLSILHSHIEDDQNNRTRFFVISKTEIKNNTNEQTSLILAVPNKPGAIYQLLAPLAEYGVSMCRIESRPARTGSWEYYFYIDIEGHQAEPKIAQALKKLQQQSTFYKCLGSYPRSAQL